MLAAAVAFLALVTAERMGELLLARENTARLIAAGAYEVARAHYPAIVAVHALWLLSLWVEAPGRPISLGFLALFVLLQAGRAWVLLTLGRRWTTRIMVVPGETLVARGPYRFLSHPNYAVVIGEIVTLPLVFGLFWIALVFTFVNAAVLWLRIRAEEQALRPGR